MDSPSSASAEEELPHVRMMTDARRAALETRLSVYTKQIDFVLGVIRCFRDLSGLWGHLLITLIQRPITEEAEKELEERWKGFGESIWRRLSLDFPTLGESH